MLDLTQNELINRPIDVSAGGPTRDMSYYNIDSSTFDRKFGRKRSNVTPTKLLGQRINPYDPPANNRVSESVTSLP